MFTDVPSHASGGGKDDVSALMMSFSDSINLSTDQFSSGKPVICGKLTRSVPRRCVQRAGLTQSVGWVLSALAMWVRPRCGWTSDGCCAHLARSCAAEAGQADEAQAHQGPGGRFGHDSHREIGGSREGAVDRQASVVVSRDLEREATEILQIQTRRQKAPTRVGQRQNRNVDAHVVEGGPMWRCVCAHLNHAAVKSPDHAACARTRVASQNCG